MHTKYQVTIQGFKTNKEAKEFLVLCESNNLMSDDVLFFVFDKNGKVLPNIIDKYEFPPDYGNDYYYHQQQFNR